jgi:hypothetical protein
MLLLRCRFHAMNASSLQSGVFIQSSLWCLHKKIVFHSILIKSIQAIGERFFTQPQKRIISISLVLLSWIFEMISQVIKYDAVLNDEDNNFMDAWLDSPTSDPRVRLFTIQFVSEAVFHLFSEILFHFLLANHLSPSRKIYTNEPPNEISSVLNCFFFLGNYCQVWVRETFRGILHKAIRWMYSQATVSS